MSALLHVMWITLWIRTYQARDEVGPIIQPGRVDENSRDLPVCPYPPLHPAQREECPIPQASIVIETSPFLPVCPYPPPNLGKFDVDLAIRDIEDIVPRHRNVRNGGSWAPDVCVARQRTAILVPFRNRTRDLGLLLQNLHNYLQQQLLNYTIFIIEQTDDDKHFNKGAILNAGWLEVSRRGAYDCIILQDVDKFPEDTRNLYMCPDGPMHLVSKRRFVDGPLSKADRIKYHRRYFDGIFSISAENYRMINGFSNEFWAWGCEDADLFERTMHYKLPLFVAEEEVGGYAETYNRDRIANPMRYILVDNGASRYKTDGLNSVRYNLQGFIPTQLYTLIIIQVLHEDPLKDIKGPK